MLTLYVGGRIGAGLELGDRSRWSHQSPPAQLRSTRKSREPAEEKQRSGVIVEGEMVLWEMTVITAYFLGLKRTYRLALRIQRRLVGPNHPRIRQFLYRFSSSFVFVVILIQFPPEDLK
ncbi:hypothetical protein B296_00035692 [Ensete ventricosum]|uniref:Uncharacterized protein n=1 Tax=Ensete ventricosum TaxID=4639 RepID=A0A426Y7C5_ENSVE|nr:hypothetical protein B296_00035692 [Ensete ventricosum]